MSGFIFSKWQSSKTRVPGTTVYLDQAQAREVVASVLPNLPADVQWEARECMNGARENLSQRANAVLQFAVTAYVSATKR